MASSLSPNPSGSCYLKSSRQWHLPSLPSSPNLLSSPTHLNFSTNYQPLSKCESRLFVNFRPEVLGFNLAGAPSPHMWPAPYLLLHLTLNLLTIELFRSIGLPPPPPRPSSPSRTPLLTLSTTSRRPSTSKPRAPNHLCRSSSFHPADLLLFAQVHRQCFQGGKQGGRQGTH